MLIPISDGFTVAMPELETVKLAEFVTKLESRAKQVLSGGKAAEELSGVLKGSFFGKTEQQIKRAIPKDWKIEPARGNGWVAKDAAGNERIRFMRPVNETVTKWERMKSGYWIRLSESGEFLDESGKVISKNLSKEEQLWQSHIPFAGVRR